jgi:hypothetical protein
MHSLVLMLILTTTAAFADCDSLFAQRGEGLDNTRAAFDCYKANENTTGTLVERARRLNRMAYLKFFSAEYFLSNKAPVIEDAMELADEAVKVFGKKYDLVAYRALLEEEKTELAWALYHYGLFVARYVDIRGIAEALRRMDDIKRSMNTILRIQQQAVAFHGAHRTLGILHTKVPGIAGGDIDLAKRYLPLAVSETIHGGGLSAYPLNNLMYADLLIKLGQDRKACEQLGLVAALSDEDVAALANGFEFETRGHVRDARATLRERRCP